MAGTKGSGGGAEARGGRGIGERLVGGGLVAFGGEFIVGEELLRLVEVVVGEIIVGNELLGEFAGRIEAVAKIDEALANGLERSGDGEAGRGEELADDKGRQFALALWERVGVGALEEGGNCLVELLFVFGGLERDGERFALGVADILEDFAA